jgi:hypothetical protein
MSEKLPEEIFDVRKRERFLQEGLLSQEQVDAYLNSLEDCADNADYSSVQMISHARGRVSGSGPEHGLEEDES